MNDFNPIPQDDLDAMQAREEAATEEPWLATLLNRCDGARVVSQNDANITICEMARWQQPHFKELFDNAHFIAHARTDQPRLRIALEAAQADNARLKEGLETLRAIPNLNRPPVFADGCAYLSAPNLNTRINALLGGKRDDE